MGGAGALLLVVGHPGRRQAPQVQIHLLQDPGVLTKAVDDPVIPVHHRRRHPQVLGVEGPLIGKEEPDANLGVTHDGPPVRLISGSAKRKASSMTMAELTHHWHQARMT